MEVVRKQFTVMLNEKFHHRELRATLNRAQLSVLNLKISF